MTEPREPIRLIASADADPLLRDVLRVIHEDAPSMAALTVLADNAERAVRGGSAAQSAGAQASAHSYPLMTKLVIAGVVAGALVYAGLQRARVDGRARPEAAAPTGAVRAPEATERVQGAADQAPEVQGADARTIDPRAQSAGQPVRASRRSPASVGGAQQRKTVSAPAQSPDAAGGGHRDAHSARYPVAATTPPSRQDPQSAQDSQEQSPGPSPATSEIELLESAQHALLREPRRALELLEQHRAAFPRGAFAQERDVLRLEAFQRLHDTTALREGARAFMQRYPRSPHLARVENLVEDLR